MPHAFRRTAFDFRLFKQLSFCPGPMRETVSGFSRYQKTVASLPGLEREKIHSVAKHVVGSFSPLIVLLDIEAYPPFQQKEWQAAWKALKQTAGGKLDLLANELARRGISLDG